MNPNALAAPSDDHDVSYSGRATSGSSEIPFAEQYADGTSYYRSQVLDNSWQPAGWLVGSLVAIATAADVASVALLADDVTIAGVADDPFIIVTTSLSLAARKAAAYFARRVAEKAVLRAALRTAGAGTLLAAPACINDGDERRQPPPDAGVALPIVSVWQNPPNPIPIPYGAEGISVDLTVQAAVPTRGPNMEVAVIGPYSYASTWGSPDRPTYERIFHIPIAVTDVLATPKMNGLYEANANIYSRWTGDPTSIQESTWTIQFAPPGSPVWELDLALPENSVVVGEPTEMSLTVRATTPEAVELMSDFHPVIIVAGQNVVAYAEDSEAFPLRRTDGSGDDEIVFEFEHVFRYPGVNRVTASATVNSIVFRADGTITVIEEDVLPSDGGPDTLVPDAGGFDASADASRPDAGMDGRVSDGRTMDAGRGDSESGRMDASPEIPDARTQDAGGGDIGIFDTTPPTTSHNAPAGWMRGPVTVTLTPTDENSGVVATVYCVDQSNTCDPGAIRGTTVTVDAEGVNYVRFLSVDDAGNVEPLQSVPVRIDNTPPVTVASVPGGGWQMPPVTVTLIPTDSLSGVGITQYCVDTANSCTPDVPGATLTISDEGEHFVRFQSIDNAGNEEAVQAAGVAIADILRNAHCELGYTICTDMNEDDSANWNRADGWANESPFNNGWRAENITFRDGVMITELNDVGCPDECSERPYASGEYRSDELFGYGFLEARMRAARHDGIVGGSLFFYHDNPWHEIDIEFLGQDTTQMQTNYKTDGVGGHETLIDLGFDASEDFHTYGIARRGRGIVWYVDGEPVHTENGSRGPLPSLPGCIKMNMWPGIGVDEWLGPFSYDGPIQSEVDWVRYSEF